MSCIVLGVRNVYGWVGGLMVNFWRRNYIHICLLLTKAIIACGNKVLLLTHSAATLNSG